MKLNDMLGYASIAAAKAGMPIIQTEAGPQILDRQTSSTDSYKIWTPHLNNHESFELAGHLKMTIDFDFQFAKLGKIVKGIAGRKQPLEMSAMRMAILEVAAVVGQEIHGAN